MIITIVSPDVADITVELDRNNIEILYTAFNAMSFGTKELENYSFDAQGEQISFADKNRVADFLKAKNAENKEHLAGDVHVSLDITKTPELNQSAKARKSITHGFNQEQKTWTAKEPQADKQQSDNPKIGTRRQRPTKP